MRRMKAQIVSLRSLALTQQQADHAALNGMVVAFSIHLS
jgi:hypothetical protein